VLFTQLRPLSSHCSSMADALRILLCMSRENLPHGFLLTLRLQTSKPIPSSQVSTDSQSSLNSFHPFYNFHFASLNCIAYGDTCSENDIPLFPTFILFKNGEMTKTFTGERSMEGLSAFVEEALESIRPGSRPKG